MTDQSQKQEAFNCICMQTESVCVLEGGGGPGSTLLVSLDKYKDDDKDICLKHSPVNCVVKIL